MKNTYIQTIYISLLPVLLPRTPRHPKEKNGWVNQLLHISYIKENSYFFLFQFQDNGFFVL